MVSPASHSRHSLHRKVEPLVTTQVVISSYDLRNSVSPILAFHDVLSVDDPELLAITPRPALALVLVFPTSSDYEKNLEEQGRLIPDHYETGDGENVMWYKQTINNACGLYAIFHAVSNGDARDLIIPDSHLSHLLEVCPSLNPMERARVIEDDADLEAAYKAVSLQGDSEVPENPEDEVDFHYVCFVKSHRNGHLYELDGDRNGPIDRGLLGPNEDVLSMSGLSVIQEFVQREKERGNQFSLLVLAPQ
ncbi:ubiquitin carboxyl-terminal hydrolase isozyme L1 [Aspergillus novofumigatus IBT 16806]|uniref:Ubiquitin carboxyl-terminal hydrolase n=1 Tax=Aspergillus novofumigatus (strain IBT 16806) TaxID=1392255 RepID=A0A2I1CH43_ASPN1|nr:ubiquitin carboxyl-terminal hydrolase isozyme L1 [Aspergillus novofumigatus IBT 16806]PKX96924.1 ubiquitin carboxyl-terminal hydrolase isozyme L1 [Aspergillus novofumigatus IBT 16806]